MFNIDEYRQIRKDNFGESFEEATQGYKKYKKLAHKQEQEKVNGHTHGYTGTTATVVCIDPAKCDSTGRYSLAPLQNATCQPAVTTSIDSFASLQKALCRPAPAKGCFPWGAKAAYKQEEGNFPMSYSANAAYASVTTAPTEIQDQRKYLTKRLDEVYATKRDPLEAAFGLTDDDAPTSPKEYAERIAAGKFIIRGTDESDKDARSYRYWGLSDLIRWRDPAKKADNAGFAAARLALKAAKLAALDTIKIDEPKAGLDAIKALEAWTPTGAAN